MWTLLSAVAILLVLRIVLPQVTESAAVDVAIRVAYILCGIIGLFVVFTWAAEYDRRNPRDY